MARFNRLIGKDDGGLMAMAIGEKLGFLKNQDLTVLWSSYTNVVSTRFSRFSNEEEGGHMATVVCEKVGFLRNQGL